MQEVLIRASRTALLFALAAIALPARSLVLGEAEVRSALGERLDARIALSATEGLALDASCFSLLRDPDAGLLVLTEGELTLARADGVPVLRVRSAAPIQEPVLMLRVRAACAGEVNDTVRQYSLLLDPRSGYAGAVSLPTVTATIETRAGDTLQSMAAKVMPGGRAARNQYLAAIRELNPELASHGDRDPLPPGTAVALPDLRTYVRARPSTAVAAAPRLPSARAELAAREPAPPKPAVERKSPARAPSGEAAPPKPRAAATAAPPKPRPAVTNAPRATAAPHSGFVLKLSSSEVDLSRSRQIDDRMRAQLRERLLVLDSDDQVAALLAMRDSLKRLETRVAELQLKLAGMPASLAARSEPAPTPASKAPSKTPETKAPEPKAAEPAAIAPPIPAPVAKPAPEVKPAAKPSEPVAVKPVEIPAPAPTPAPAPPAPAPSPPAAVTPPPVASAPEPAPPQAAPSPAPPPASTAPTGGKPIPRPPSVPSSGLPDWLWGLVAILVALAALLAYRVMRRRPEEDEEYEATEEQPEDLVGDIADPQEPSAEEAIFAEEPVLVDDEPRRHVASDADLATRLPENAGELRRRYIEERFPEIGNRTIVLDDSNSVVKGARLFYEDGAQSRAVELLQFAIENSPGEVKTWLALFEIFRLERETAEFAGLAARFKSHHGDSEYWRKVQYFGREIDPGNALYKEESFNTLETIGPSEARRLAAATAAFDPIAENWLNAPMDFQNEVLANELRQALMADAALSEQDLIPNPMPALRNVEMFTVA